MFVNQKCFVKTYWTSSGNHHTHRKITSKAEFRQSAFWWESTFNALV